MLCQETIKVRATGVSISRDITPKEALNAAIKDAQQNAYLKAGIAEQVQVASIQYEISTPSSVYRLFSEISSIESNAQIIIDSIYPESRKFDENGNMIITVDIDATVYMQEEKSDPTFYFNIDGLKDTYYENEIISFSITPTQDGYLKIFAINSVNKAYLLYPYTHPTISYLSDKNDSLFRKGVPTYLPVHEAYRPGYSVEMQTSYPSEINNLIFVFLKKNIAWTEKDYNLNSILKWIYEIPCDSRSIQNKTVVIKRL